MACVAPTNLSLVHVTGPGVLVFTWDYEGNSHVGFVLEIFKLNPESDEFERRDVRTAFKSARKYTFRKFGLMSGEVWKVVISTRCKNCTLSDSAEIEVPLE